MKRFFLLLLMMLSLSTTWAQKWIIDPVVNDSLRCMQVAMKDTLWKAVDASSYVWIPRGTVVDSIAGNNASDIVFIYNGKHYQTFKKHLRWSDENPDSVQHYQGAWDARSHSDLGHWCATPTPIKLILIIFAITAIVGWVGASWKPMRKVAIVVVPLGILSASLLELFMYYMLGNDAFWWCDYDRYGFFGSLGRLIPFALAVAYQVYSIYQFDDVMFPESGLQISVKPAAIAIGAVVPVFFLYLIIFAAWLGYRGDGLGYGAVAVILGMLIIGIGWALAKNIKAMGKIGGIVATIFSIIYIIACLMSLVAIIYLIIRLIVQIMIAIGAIAMISFMGSKFVRGSDGHVYKDNGIFGYERVD